MILARYRIGLPSDGGDVIDQLLVQRIAEPDGDLQELVEPLLADRAHYEGRLLERFQTFSGEQELAAIELLSCIGSDACVPLLLRLSHRAATRVPAIHALLRTADTRTLTWLALREWNPDLREEITAALRARGDEQAVAFVLATQGERSWSTLGSDSWQHAESL